MDSGIPNTFIIDKLYIINIINDISATFYVLNLL